MQDFQTMEDFLSGSGGFNTKPRQRSRSRSRSGSGGSATFKTIQKKKATPAKQPQLDEFYFSEEETPLETTEQQIPVLARSASIQGETSINTATLLDEEPDVANRTRSKSNSKDVTKSETLQDHNQHPAFGGDTRMSSAPQMGNEVDDFSGTDDTDGGPNQAPQENAEVSSNHEKAVCEANADMEQQLMEAFGPENQPTQKPASEPIPEQQPPQDNAEISTNLEEVANGEKAEMKQQLAPEPYGPENQQTEALAPKPNTEQENVEDCHMSSPDSGKDSVIETQPELNLLSLDNQETGQAESESTHQGQPLLPVQDLQPQQQKMKEMVDESTNTDHLYEAYELQIKRLTAELDKSNQKLQETQLQRSDLGEKTLKKLEDKFEQEIQQLVKIHHNERRVQKEKHQREIFSFKEKEKELQMQLFLEKKKCAKQSIDAEAKLKTMEKHYREVIEGYRHQLNIQKLDETRRSVLTTSSKYSQKDNSNTQKGVGYSFTKTSKHSQKEDISGHKISLLHAKLREKDTEIARLTSKLKEASRKNPSNKELENQLQEAFEREKVLQEHIKQKDRVHAQASELGQELQLLIASSLVNKHEDGFAASNVSKLKK